jgi:hypothetical protein
MIFKLKEHAKNKLGVKKIRNPRKFGLVTELKRKIFLVWPYIAFHTTSNHRLASPLSAGGTWFSHALISQ